MSDLSKAIKEMDDAWKEPNPAAAVAAHFAEDGVLLDMTAGEPVTGREAIAEALSVYTTALSAVEFESRLVSDAGGTATVEWTVTGVHSGDLEGLAPTGNRIELRGVNVLEIGDDGLIAEERSYWDSGTLLRQVGAL